MVNYGVENPGQSEEVKQKKKEKCMVNYGLPYATQSEEVKQKIRETCIVNYGVENPSQNEEVKERRKQTNIKRFGVPYATQNSEISEKQSKTAYKSKDFHFPSGRIDRVQGYEPFGLNELLFEENIHEDEIITNRSSVPRVSYIDKNGKTRYYFVDIYIPSQKRCIEIKSTWTAEKKKDYIFIKQQALKNAGYKCEIWIYNAKGEKIYCYI